MSCDYDLRSKKGHITISEVEKEKKSVHIFLIPCKSILVGVDCETKRLEGNYLQEFVAIQYSSLSKARRTWNTQKL